MKTGNSLSKAYFTRIINRGFYISLLNFILLGLVIFSLTQFFMDPLNDSMWVLVTSIAAGFWLLFLISTLYILMKIIVNNEWFFQDAMKRKKRYFIVAIILFAFNSAISFSMFKKCLVI
ncbi:MAG: hypothetical protein ACRCXE_03435 [Metamycoplasmataceae bacterium]